MNISEFERTKPKKTYRNIKKLMKLVDEVENRKEWYGADHPTEILIKKFCEATREVHDSFLKGE